MPSLRFRADGTFTIAQFTDLHLCDGTEKDALTYAAVKTVVDAERPDLVVFTGDILSGRGCSDHNARIRELTQPLVASGTPWAAVFGNHDDEGSASRHDLLRMMQSYPGCLAEAGPKDVPGVGNYVLPLHGADGGQVKALLYFLDSNAYAPEDVKGYGWVHHEQVAWYRRTAQQLAATYGANLPALAFFHIPLPEYDDVWNSRTCYGVKQEDVCAPRLNSGLFLAMYEMGDVMGTFVGHDHVNDYVGDYHGIRLCYGRVTGHDTYPRNGEPRGGRLIRLIEGVRDFETWIRHEDGALLTEQSAHEPGA